MKLIESTKMTSKSIIRLRNVDVFQSDTLVLSSVNLDIARGNFVYLIGKVGCGKSTLLKTLNAELRASSGEIEVAGFDLSKIKKNEVPFLRRKIGVVFQDFKLLPDRTVRENLSFVLNATGWKDPKAIEDRMEDLLDLVGLIDKIDVMPHRLSAGEQQRVVIARALLNNPEIILADEPTGNLDPDTSEELMMIFNELNKQGRTIVMATHDYLVLHRFPARTIIIEDRRLHEPERSTEELDFFDLLK